MQLIIDLAFFLKVTGGGQSPPPELFLSIDSQPPRGTRVIHGERYTKGGGALISIYKINMEQSTG